MTLASVRYEEGSFTTSAGTRLYECRWLPAGDVRAAVVLVHGFAEHSGRYAHVGEHLAQRGYAVHAFDQRGHGRSEGDRAYVRSFSEYLADLGAYLARVRALSNAPLFLLGHSMGGTVVTLSLCVDRPAVRGALLSGPVLTMGKGLGARLLARVLLVLGRIVPRLPLMKLKASDVSRDPDVVARYDSDPLVYRGRMRAGLVAAMVRALRRIDAEMETIEIPLLIMHGTADALARPDGSRELYERAASPDRTLRLYEGFYHEILNEPEREDVLRDITAWLDARA